jgi:hypothetical protein
MIARHESAVVANLLLQSGFPHHIETIAMVPEYRDAIMETIRYPESEGGDNIGILVRVFGVIEVQTGSGRRLFAALWTLLIVGSIAALIAMAGWER